MIKSDYVNLFEYDVILDDFIDQRHTKLYNMNVDSIDYNPISMRTEFITNPRWVEHIIPAISQVHRFNLVHHFSNMINKNPNSLWSSTSNTTFRSDVFNEYMNWMEPLVDHIKDTETCGHAHERSITFFLHHKRKRQFLTQGWLTHLQLDSHKTQGHEVDNQKSYEKLFKNQR